ncbi:Kae1-associated serine/threonine protein kinase [Candidatus Woesearchaeota archaeon]|nr:Kae1-associated serine/threonine protein kinase [Candidatus Woesearchaeota archaeon]
MTTKLAQGAEAIIYTDSATVTKDRFAKTYRHPELDEKLRKTRTRREAKLLTKLSEAQFPAPQLVKMDDKEMKVQMEHVPGRMVKETIDALEKEKKEKEYLRIFKEIGGKVALLHNNGIVHHDLTTSNMIMHADKKEVYFIDFGLSFFSDKTEDYAVDLHLLKHALESRHHRIWEKCFDAVVSGYRENSTNANDILARLEKVEKRGRYKTKH